MEYKDLNEYFVPNHKNQKPFLYSISYGTTEDKKFLLEIIEEHGESLSPTFNFPDQCSILHCLALQDKEFDDLDKKIFKAIMEKTYVVTKNRYEL